MTKRKSALRVTDASKRFGPTHALREVSLEFQTGTIHALLGGNGSGKSTLIKALAGVQPADDGFLEIGSTRVRLPDMTPARARELGLRFVHQQSSTLDALTVAENLAIGGPGFDTNPFGRIRWRRTRQRAAEVLERFEIEARPEDEIGSLSPANQTMVAIARALQDQEHASDGVLLLDEPTAALPAHEVDILLDALSRYAKTGQTIVYVTHRLEEVFVAADQATLMSDGRVIDTVLPRELTHDALVELMVGRPVTQIERGQESARGSVILEVEGLAAGALKDISFSARAGEIVGVAGLIGSGRSTLLEALFGVSVARAGSVRLHGHDVKLTSPRDAMAAGFSFVPENRGADAAFAELSLKENLSMASAGRYWRRGLPRHRAEARDAQALRDAFGIKAASIDTPMNSLSGGNQQKAILARWLHRNPKVLLLDEPTQGVDVGARAEIYGQIRRAVDAGSVAIVATSDTEELAAICDRVLVLRRGRKVTEVSGTDISSEALQRLIHADGAGKGAA